MTMVFKNDVVRIHNGTVVRMDVGTVVRTDDGSLISKGLRNVFLIRSSSELDVPHTPSNPGGESGGYFAFNVRSMSTSVESTAGALCRRDRVGAWFLSQEMK